MLLVPLHPPLQAAGLEAQQGGRSLHGGVPAIITCTARRLSSHLLSRHPPVPGMPSAASAWVIVSRRFPPSTQAMVAVPTLLLLLLVCGPAAVGRGAPCWGVRGSVVSEGGLVGRATAGAEERAVLYKGRGRERERARKLVKGPCLSSR